MSATSQPPATELLLCDTQGIGKATTGRGRKPTPTASKTEEKPSALPPQKPTSRETALLPTYTKHPSRHTKDSADKPLPAWILDGSVAYEPMIPKLRTA